MLSHREDALVFAKRLIRKEIEELTGKLASSPAGSMEEYKQRIGKIRGLETAVGKIDEALKRYTEELDDG